MANYEALIAQALQRKRQRREEKEERKKATEVDPLNILAGAAGGFAGGGEEEKILSTVMGILQGITTPKTEGSLMGPAAAGAGAYKSAFTRKTAREKLATEAAGEEFKRDVELYKVGLKAPEKLTKKLVKPPETLIGAKPKETYKLGGKEYEEFETPEMKKEKFGQAKSLREAFVKDAGEYVKIRDSYARIVQSAKEPSAAGDLAMIFNFMKMLDPGSVVREGEFANAQNATGVPGRIRSGYNNLLKGTRLNPDQRKDFFSRAQKFWVAQADQHEKRLAIHGALADKYGIDRDEVTIDIKPTELVKWRPDLIKDVQPEKETKEQKAEREKRQKRIKELKEKQETPLF